MWLRLDRTLLPLPCASDAFVSWILMALLVAMTDKTTGADGSWRFGVTAGGAKTCTHTHMHTHPHALYSIFKVDFAPCSAAQS